MEDDSEVRLGWKFISVSDKRFMPACQVHDWAYRANSDAQKTGMTRKEVDDILLSMMLKLAEDEDPWVQWAARRRAYFYYRVVRLVGSPLWEGK